MGNKINSSCYAFLILLIPPLFLLLISLNDRSKGFFENSHWQFKYTSIWTPYLFEGSVNETLFLDSDCTPLQIWTIIRHGAKYPKSDVIKIFKNELPLLRAEILYNHLVKRKGSLSRSNILRLKSWALNPELEESRGFWLSPEGKKELFGIGKRYRERFPQIFKDPINNDSFIFKHTTTQRTEKSAQNFVKGLFGEMDQDKINLETLPTRFYRKCKKWMKEVKNNPLKHLEVKLFENSKPFRRMLARTGLRLGFERRISTSDVNLIYNACSFESSFHPKTISPWCSAFDEEDLNILEYREDLKHNSYTHELTYKMACPVVQDFVNTFSEKAQNPESSLKFIAYFSHSGAMEKILARLGMFKDSELLRSDNFEKFRVNRKWRASYMDKFATNLAFALYKCGGEYKVGAFFQEKPISFPPCNGNWICPLEQVKSNLNEIVSNCDMDSMCKI